MVGGGNSAGQAALHLSKNARCVHLVVRGKTLDSTMSDYLVQRVRSSLRITVHLNSEIEAIAGEERLRTVILKPHQSGQLRSLQASDVFVMIGADPNTEWLEDYLVLEHNGFIRTGVAAWETVSRFATSCPGVFAIGDVRAGSVKRVASAVGEGSVVISDIHQYLEKSRAAEPLAG